MSSSRDLAPNRLPQEAYAQVFCDKNPPLDLRKAKIESMRCYFCYDAPCVQACPTGINIPGFIRKISTENIKGAAVEILEENIMGGTCARVCPVESLCEEACVRNKAEDKPVTIGLLQRFATDWLFDQNIQPFSRAARTGKKIAVVGAGPAGLSCAHSLAQLGHDIMVFESKEKPGGLNEYGLAAYKVVDDFVQKEIDFILSVGGVEIKYGHTLGKNISLSELRKNFDAVFLGVGLSGVSALQLEGEELEGVVDAVGYISNIRQTPDISKLRVGRRVVVIGGGNTAIDIAVQTKLLGAEFVTIVYRRGPGQMGATWHEQELAQTSGVLIKHWAKPIRLLKNGNEVTAVEFERTELDSSGKLLGRKEFFLLEADQIFKAIGQQLEPSELGDVAKMIEIKNGKITVDQYMRTTLDRVYAGGDCVNGGKLTVVSVQDGKIAANDIHQKLMGTSGGSQKIGRKA